MGSALGARWWPASAGVCLALAAGLAVAGCGSSNSSKPLACPVNSTAGGGTGATRGPGAPVPTGKGSPAVAAGWTLPGGNLANTRDVASAITSSDVSRLGVAWTVPLRIPITHTDGAYATTPVVVHGVVYMQDLDSNVMAISLATGKVRWEHRYNSPNGGPDGVTVAHGVVYGATNHAAFALPVVVDGGKAGIVIELNAQTGKPIWKVPVGRHNGHDHDGLLTEHATPTSHVNLPRQFCLEPGIDGGIVTQLASNGSTTFAALSDKPTPVCGTGTGCAISRSAAVQAVFKATGEMVAVSQDTGRIEWDTRLPSSPYGAATVTNNVVLTTTFSGDLYALSSTSGAILRTIPLSAGTNAPVTVDGDYVIAGAGVPLSRTQQPMIIAYKLGASGKLPETVHP